MNLYERLKKPTPKFFRRLRNIGIALSAIGGAILTLPIIMPAMIITFAGYLIVGGTVASVVSQTVINDGNENSDDEQNNGDSPTFSGRIIPFPRNKIVDANT